MNSSWAAGFVVAVLLATSAALGRHTARERRSRAFRVLLPETAQGSAGGTIAGSGPRRVSTGGEPGSGNCGLSDAAMVLELIAAMLEAGSGVGRALEIVADSAAPALRQALVPVASALSMGAEWAAAWHTIDHLPDRVSILRDALTFAAFTGAPSATILYAQAARIRRDEFRQAEKRAATLGVKLVIPLGLCSLPAFICLGVVPVLLALIPS
ncbi:type II secretion system F family protein [Pseudarthrobacter sp. PS3-L1]|uniref:type II secretion system F family protein n=1 Tax=Pseudarthrobacter sp. PS3-L1 TaxID=3046207 RepID=UPI0024BAA9AE|nr:type II secretion system F family protein [Pseudarthrobacter sp. PS3-L1]MDJ0319217.1 type II secretion system F family protein [Pseudarthrobacter sp. PS3-L1]